MADEPESVVLKHLVAIRADIKSLDAKFEEKFDALSNRVDALTYRVEGLALRIDVLEARMARYERNVGALADSVEIVIKQLRVLLATHDPDYPT